MNKRKILIAGICAIMTLALTGCASKDNEKDNSNTSSISSVESKTDDSTESTTENSTDSNTESNKTEDNKTDSSTESSVTSNTESDKTSNTESTQPSNTESTTNSSSSTTESDNEGGVENPAVKPFSNLMDYPVKVGSATIGLPWRLGDLSFLGWVPDIDNSAILVDNIIINAKKDNTTIEVTVKGTERSQATDDSRITNIYLDAESLGEMSASYANLIIGKSTSTEMTEKFGMPHSMDIENNIETYEYYRVPGDEWGGRVTFTFVDTVLKEIEINVPQE